MKHLAFLGILSSILSASIYTGPQEMVELSRGTGDYQVGLAEENVPIGPYRLIATDSLIYISDQLNQRLLCYDTSGVFQKKIKTRFRAADMAMDDKSLIYLLENRTQPARVVILEDDGDESEEMRIKYQVSRPPTDLLVHPAQGLLILSGRELYRPVAVGEGEGGTYGALYRLVQMRQSEVDSLLSPNQELFRTGVLLDASGQSTRTLLATYGGRVWIGTETCIQDKSGSLVMRRIEVREQDKIIDEVNVPSNYFSYDVGWRNVSVDPRGDIYVFTSSQDGKATILRWRVP